jgi:hypothetical protein
MIDVHLLQAYGSQCTKIYLSNTNITELPEILLVDGDLYLENTPITELPKTLKVRGSLHLKNTGVTEVPKTARIGGVVWGLEEVQQRFRASHPDGLRVPPRDEFKPEPRG